MSASESPMIAYSPGDSGWSGSWVSRIDGTPTPTPEATPRPALAPGEKVDINTAERADFERLPDPSMVAI